MPKTFYCRNQLGTCMETFDKVDVVYGNGAVFRKTLLFSSVLKVWPRKKKCWKVKYFELKSEYHYQIAHKKTGLKI